MPAKTTTSHRGSTCVPRWHPLNVRVWASGKERIMLAGARPFRGRPPEFRQELTSRNAPPLGLYIAWLPKKPKAARCRVSCHQRNEKQLAAETTQPRRPRNHPPPRVRKMAIYLRKMALRFSSFDVITYSITKAAIAKPMNPQKNVLWRSPAKLFHCSVFRWH
jgi:hypothetical protein